jgi:hypothetical protein
MEDQSWMYRSGDMLSHLKGVCVFLETVVQHASHRVLYRLHERWKPNMCLSFTTPWSNLWEKNQMT